MTNNLVQLADRHLRHLCVEVTARDLGSDGNRAATSYVEARFREHGLAVERQEFPCIAWDPLEETLLVRGEPFSLHASPYSWPCDGTGPLRVIRSREQLASNLCGAVLLLQGALVAQQLVPKDYPFYSNEEHSRLVEMLERSGALVVLAATGKNPMATAALSPFPLVEDGAFALPSAYMTEAEGARLAAHDGEMARIRMRVRREPSNGFNVVAHVGAKPARHVVCAHIDAKRGSPGAIDNAGGIVVLLLLAELLRGFDGVELVAFNGEDDYSAAGELAYLGNRPDLERLSFAINIDGIGFREGETEFSTYGFTDAEERQLARLLSRPGLRAGSPWFQSDHAVFVQRGVKAIALTTSEFSWVWSNLAHTERDRVELVDPTHLVRAAEAIRDVLRSAH